MSLFVRNGIKVFRSSPRAPPNRLYRLVLLNPIPNTPIEHATGTTLNAGQAPSLEGVGGRVLARPMESRSHLMMRHAHGRPPRYEVEVRPAKQRKTFLEGAGARVE